MQAKPEVQSSYLFPAIVFLLVAQPVLGTLSQTASEILVIPLAVTLVGGVWSLDRSGGGAGGLRARTGVTRRWSCRSSSRYFYLRRCT